MFEFHSKLVLRHLRASSLPMRLWGWEQTEDLIALSYKHRWDAKAFLVRDRRRRSAEGCIYYPMVVSAWSGSDFLARTGLGLFFPPHKQTNSKQTNKETSSFVQKRRPARSVSRKYFGCQDSERGLLYLERVLFLSVHQRRHFRTEISQ